MLTLEEFANTKIDKLKLISNYRTLDTIKRFASHYVEYNNQKLLSFSCNDYLGLSYNRAVKQKSLEICAQYLSGASASRFISGNSPLYTILEEKLANYHGTESCTIFGSGYLTNIGIIPAIMNKQDLIIADRFIHSCILDGIKLSGAKFLRFEHNNINHCSILLEKYRKLYHNCLIITEDIFSMDGDIAPLSSLVEIAKYYNSWLLSDGAHLITKSTHKIDLRVGTLSKALGGYGGYVCGSKSIINYINNTARSLIFSTALPPIILAEAIAAINFINENPNILSVPLIKAQYFTNLMKMKSATSQIVPVIIGESSDTLNAAHQLMSDGFLVKAVRPPTVPSNTARLRFTFSSEHQNDDIQRLANSVLKIIES
ncbi:8-amino-7-oxononanoate synthase [Rickettsiales bacterium Ac37b]|nr:8-amino-7-oxononanoate synthase [Rickettsiales bacterium Ac37b]